MNSPCAHIFFCEAYEYTWSYLKRNLERSTNLHTFCCREVVRKYFQHDIWLVISHPSKNLPDLLWQVPELLVHSAACHPRRSHRSIPLRREDLRALIQHSSYFCVKIIYCCSVNGRILSLQIIRDRALNAVASGAYCYTLLFIQSLSSLFIEFIKN